jgi:bleomycin hydrolase
MPKADRVMYEDISPNHAMVITGVDTTAEGTARKWLVENSWGTDKGKSGYWTMYDDWYDQNVLLVMVDKKVLEPDDLALFEKKPVVIEDWEPFFTALRNLQ